MRVADIIALATEKGLILTTAESCTGGMVAAALTDVAGSSAVFTHGVVTYSNAAKTELLGVPADLFDSVGAVSEEVAAAMAEGALSMARADIAVGVTGIAGPGGSEFKPEGRVCFGLATAEGTETQTVEFGAIGRAQVRSAATRLALDLLAKAVDSHSA